MRTRAGAILPAYCTALGKTLLAYAPEADVLAWVATQKFPPLTAHTITTAKRLLRDLRVIRERGYGIDDEEREKGVRCLAAPVRNHNGGVVAAVSVAGPTDRMPPDLAVTELAPAVVAAARAISIDLGAVEDMLGAVADTATIGSHRAASPAHGGRR
jgi:DNA-binding IclR family transcriptional regulator